MTTAQGPYQRPSRTGVHLLDVVVILWVLGGLLLGIRLHDEVQGLTGLTVTVERVGGQLEGLGGSLGDLNIPLVGGIDDAADQARDAGKDARVQARTARDSVESVASLLAIAVIALILVPVLFAWLPLRLRWAADHAARKRLAARAQEDPELHRLLAQRTIVTMSERQLDGLPGRPWATAEPPDAPLRS